MKPKPATLALSGLGTLLLLVAAVRFAIDLLRSLHATRATSTDASVTWSFSIDYLTLGLAFVGVLLCILGFSTRERRS